ncbi:MAG TPA: uroporphyrinogen decarboxylase family protein [Armatimonadota bacterium]|nr:uroporphyrinogen decarboxylase family protein [Armatimonadota bacterium]
MSLSARGGDKREGPTFDPAAVMLRGTPEDVRRAARRNLADGGDRLCVSPGCEVPVDTPPANLTALDEALTSHHRGC